MALLMGVLLALAVGLFATAVGLDRDRAFYPTVTIVIASLYIAELYPIRACRPGGRRSV